MRVLRTACCAFALTTLASSIAVRDARAQDDDCDKNHYILDVDCRPLAVSVPIGNPGAIVADPVGHVYFSSQNVVFRIDPEGRLTRVAGTGLPGFAGDGGPASKALLNIPWLSYPEAQSEYGWMDFWELLGPLAIDRAGNLYIGDAYNNRVRKVGTDGMISTIFGDGRHASTGDGGPVTEASIIWPQGLAASDDGTLFVTSGFELRKISPEGVVSTLVSGGCERDLDAPGLCAPQLIAIDAAGNLLATDNHCRVRKVRPDGTVATIAGAPWRPCGYAGDGGPATHAAISWSFGVVADLHGNVFIADTHNDCIRRIDAAGVISTFAGVCSVIWGRGGFSGDHGLASDARLRKPHGVAVDMAGNVYIADSGNLRIRKVGLDGIITTIAGDGTSFPAKPSPNPQ